MTKKLSHELSDFGQIVALMLPSCVTLGKLPHHPVPPFPTCDKGTVTAHTPGTVQECSELEHFKSGQNSAWGWCVSVKLESGASPAAQDKPSQHEPPSGPQAH